MSIKTVIVCIASLLVCSGVAAQETHRLGSLGDHVIQVSLSSSRKVSFHATNSPKVKLSNSSSAATVASSGDAAIVAYFDGSKPQLRIASLSRGRVKLGTEQTVTLPKMNKSFPFAVVATTTPAGFTVFYQFVEARDPSAAHTMMVKVTEGRAANAVEIPVPWGLVDATWNGKGYHLALIYPNGPRLSMVSTSPAGRPEQHPDWASAVGVLSDVHLVRKDGQIHAYYQIEGHLLRADVTRIGSWGREPAPAHKVKKIDTTHLIFDKDGVVDSHKRLP